MARYAPSVLNVKWRTVLYFSTVASFVVIIVCRVNRRKIENELPEMRLLKNQRLPVSAETNLSGFLATERFPGVTEFELNWIINKFDNEQARVIGFRNHPQSTPSNASSKKVIYLATPYFGEWNAKHYYSLHIGDATFRRYSCPIKECHVTKDPSEKADAVLFHLRDLQVYSLPKQRTPEQVWILYSMEPPWLEIKDLRKFKGVFNWTMSYRRGSDVLMQYGFVGTRLTSSIANKRHRDNVAKINRGVWLVSNCRTDSNREEYVRRLKKVFPIDVFGGCGREACRPAESAKCYSKLETRYKFYLAFENAMCRDYVTEKLFNALEFDMVPVVLGGADYSSLVPDHSIISAMDFASPEELGRYLWEVSRNDSLYRSYFSWKAYYRSYMQPWMCDLCKKLHEGSTSTKAIDLEDWWNEGSSCKRWFNNSFGVPEKSVFPAYHTDLFV